LYHPKMSVLRAAGVSSDSEDRPRGGHEDGAEDEHFPAADPVGGCGDPEGNDRVAEEGEREEETDFLLVESDRYKVEREDDGEETVGEKPQSPGREEQPDIGTRQDWS
jgi:hypothetical protein